MKNTPTPQATLLPSVAESTPRESRKRVDKPTLRVEKIMYGIKDAAFAMSVSKRFIEQLLHDKKLSYRRMGKRVLIPASELRRLSRQDNL